MTSPSVHDTHVFILAGGLGSRLRSEFSGPKVLAPIGQKAFLLYQLQLLKKQGFRHITLLGGYGAEKLQAFIKAHPDPELSLQFSLESGPLGTAGAIRLAFEKFPQVKKALVLNGDTFFDADFKLLLRHSSTPFSLALTYSKEQEAYGKCIIDQHFLMQEFIEKEESTRDGYINAGAYYLDRSVLDYIPALNKISLEKEVLPKLVQEKKLQGLPLIGKFLDIGTAANYQQAQREIPQWLKLPKLACLFLDRDGVLIYDKQYLGDPKLVELVPGSVELLHWADQHFSKKIVLTNQAGIGRGHFSEEQFHQVTQKIVQLFSEQKIHFDAWYFCPDHPIHGQGRYLKDGPLRKPGCGMLLLAGQEFPIDLEKSVMIGDKDSDVLNIPGLKTYLVQGDYPIKKNSSILFPDLEALQNKMAHDFGPA